MIVQLLECSPGQPGLLPDNVVDLVREDVAADRSKIAQEARYRRRRAEHPGGALGFVGDPAEIKRQRNLFELVHGVAARNGHRHDSSP